MMSTVVSDLGKSLASAKLESELNLMTNEIVDSLENPENCWGAMKDAADQAISYAPAGMGPYEQPIDSLSIHGEKVLDISAATVLAYDKDFEFTKLALASVGLTNRVPPRNVKVRNAADMMVDAEKYYVHLKIEGKYLKGNQVNRNFKVSIPLNVFVDPVAPKQVMGCTSKLSREIFKAEATREGVIVESVSCVDAIPLGNADPLIQGYAAADVACGGDANGDKICDGNFQYAVLPSPITSAPVGSPQLNLYINSFPTRDVGALGAAPLNDQPEGRCVTSINRNDSLQNPRRIFATCNDCEIAGMGSYYGLGCRNMYGWYLDSCTGKVDGLRTQNEKVIYDSINGIEYCASQQFERPHGGVLGESSLKQAWLSTAYALKVTCKRME